MSEEDGVGRLPDFLIIGAYKCGTTSLVEYLGQHSQVFLPWLQEPNYFAYPADIRSKSRKPEVDWESIYRRHRARTIDQYHALFEDAPVGVMLGECSPEYMRSEHAWRRIQDTVPDVKLLALLRNPTDRAYSDYQAFVRDSIEQETFEEAIRRPHGVEPGHQYVATGFYGAQLTPYFKAFPREHIKVLLTEDLRTGGTQLLHGVCEWLGIQSSDWQPDLSTTRNISGRPGNLAVSTAYRLRRHLRPWLKPMVPDWAQRRADGLLASGLRRETMTPETRRELIEMYRDDIHVLEGLIDRDLSAWMR
jgi:hypothetical protein